MLARSQHRSLPQAARMLALAAAALSAASLVPAQATPAKPSAAAQATTAKPSAATTHPSKRRKPRAKAATPAPQAAAPAPPPAPNWPINSQPERAAVTWDGHGLRIEAANSSLQQILTDITAATGAKIEGTASDQRVYGVYGPGAARDVLAQLLQGSGYNIVMMGENGQGVPRQVVLTNRNADGSAPVAAMRPQAQPEDDFEDTPEPQMETAPAPPPQPPANPAEMQNSPQRPQ